MWAAQSLAPTGQQRFLSSSGMGAMGYALPAAIGASMTGRSPESVAFEPTVCICGDGGIQCNIQEFQTIARNQLPIKIIVLNNKSLGMVRQFQKSYFDSRFVGTVWGYDSPDFEKVANSYNIPAKTIEQPKEINKALEWLWSDPNAPALLNVILAEDVGLYPKQAHGKPFGKMEPLEKPTPLAQ